MKGQGASHPGKRYDSEFERESVRLADTSGKTDRQIERDLGLYQGAIRRWRDELEADPIDAFPGTAQLGCRLRKEGQGDEVFGTGHPKVAPIRRVSPYLYLATKEETAISEVRAMDKGKRGWGAAGKHLVFGLYQRNGKVLTFPIPDRSRNTLTPLVTSHTKAGSLYYTDDWHAYTWLSVKGDHVVVRKEEGVPKGKGRHHINGIEGFWSFSKNWLYQYRGIPRHHFHLYLKETELS